MQSSTSIAARPKHEGSFDDDVYLEVRAAGLHGSGFGAHDEEYREDEGFEWPADEAEEDSVGAEWRRELADHAGRVENGEYDEILAEELQEEEQLEHPAPHPESPPGPRPLKQHGRRFAVR